MSNKVISWIKKLRTKINEQSPQIITDKDHFYLITKCNDYSGMYDGKFHSADIESVNDCSLFFSEDNHSWSSVAPSFLDCGLKTVYVKAVRNKRIELHTVKIEITKRNIILVSNNAQKEFDGLELSNSDISILGDGFVDNEGVFAQAISSISTVGRMKNEIEYSFFDGTNPENYSICFEHGELVVTEKLKKIEYTLYGNNYTCLYDGEEKYISGLQEDTFEYMGREYRVSGIHMAVSGTNAGTYETEIKGHIRVVDSNDKDVSDQFLLHIIPGLLTITPREIHIESTTKTAEYTGDILSDSKVIITGDGFIEKDCVAITVCGKQTVPGSCINHIKIDFSKNVNLANYKIHTTEGILKVIDRIAKPDITIESPIYIQTYTGNEYSFEEKVKYVFENNGHIYHVTGSIMQVSGTNAGVYHGEVNGDLKVYDEASHDVTAQFIVNLKPLKLEINKRKIIIKSSSAEKEYDGWPLSSAGFEILGDGIADCDELSCEISTKITNVGKVNNEIHYAFTKGCSDNYEVELIEGKLTISDRKKPLFIEHQLKSETCKYNGYLQKLEECIDLDLEVNGKTYHIEGVKGTAEGCHIGCYEMQVSGTPMVTDSEGHDVSKQFSVSVIPGMLTINQRNVNIESVSKQAEYSGGILSHSDVIITGDGFIEADHVLVSATGKQILPGTCLNHIQVGFPKNCNPENYNITITEGILTVTDRKEKPVITVETSDYIHTYTGHEFIFDEAIIYNFKDHEHDYHIAGGCMHVSGTNAGIYYGTLVGDLRVYDNLDQDVTGQFIIELKPSKLEIKKRHVIIQSSSAKKEFDGWPLSNAEYEILGDGIADNDEFICKTTTQITNVGTTNNNISYAFTEDSCNDNYEIVLNTGELTVTDRKIPYHVELQLESQLSLYNGSLQKYEHSLNSDIEVNGKVYHVSGIKGVAEGTDAGHYTMNLSGSALVINENGKDVSNQFEVSVIPGSLHINYREILIESGSSTRQYDGTILENSEILISGEGFAEGEGILAQTTSSITAIGAVKNEIRYHFIDNTKPDNYAIKLCPGLLTVIPRNERIRIALRANSKTSLYDGTEQSVSGLENHTFEYLGNTFSTSIDITAKGKDADTYWTVSDGMITVCDSEGRDVSDQFDIHVIPGKLRINRREVIIESASVQTEYSGDILSDSNVIVKGDGFADTENITVSALGKQRIPGTSINSIHIDFPDTVNPANYYIRKIEGELTVTDRLEKPIIEVKLDDKEFIYSGNEYVYEEPISFVFYDNNHLYKLVNGVLYSEGINAGEYPITLLDSLEVHDEWENDVTDQFELRPSEAFMKIQKRHVTVTPILASKEYDGKPLTSNIVAIGEDGFAVGDGIEVYSDSSLMLPGQCENIIHYSFQPGTNPDNYIIAVESGELIILDRDVKYHVELVGESVETVFDGTEKELPEFVNLDFELNDCRYHIGGISNVVIASDEGIYQANNAQTLFVYDDYWNDVTTQFDVDVQYGSLTIHHNTDHDIPNNGSDPEEEIDEYDIAIQEIFNEMSGIEKSEHEVQKYSRKVLESLYVDHIQLLSGQGMVDPKYDFMLAEYPEISDFSILRNRIVRDFANADLLCQIEISDSEYERLREYSRTRYLNNKRNEKRILVDILFSVFLVHTGIRYYEQSYWSHVAEMLGVAEIDPVNRVWVGGTVTKTLLAFGKPVFSENEYVTNILMHSFVTDSFANRFFDYIFQYYSIDMERDLSGIKEIDISYLCNSIINPYAKRKQLLSKYTAMSIRGAYEYCKNVVTNTLHMIDCSFWDEEYDEYMLDGRLERKFEDWKHQSDFYQTEKRKHDSTGNRNRLFRAPHLMCDISTGRFSIKLPPQIVHIVDEDERPDVRWFVITKERQEFSCDLIEGYSGYKTNEIVFRPDPQQIFEKHVFLLFVNRQMVRSFTWDKRMVNFFKPNGIWLKGERLEVGLTYAFGRDDSEINSDALLYVSRKNNLKFYELNIHKDDLVCVPDENNYYVGSIPKAGLTAKGRLNEVHALTGNNDHAGTQVYNEIPTLVIDVTQEQYPGVAVFLNKQVHKLSSLKYTDVRMGRISEKKYYFVDIQDMTGLRVGWNKIVIDYPKTAMHHVYEFYYHPSLNYSFLNAPYVFAEDGFLQIQRSSSGTFATNSQAKLEEDVQEQYFNMVDVEDGYIYHQLEDDCILKILVPMLQYSWDNIHWNYCKIDEIWHAHLNSILYLKYPEDRISLCVEGSNEYISMIGYRKQQNGIIVCDLTKLKSYFSSEKIMETIALIAGDIRVPFVKILQKSFLFGVHPTCDYESNIIHVNFDLVGDNTYYADLFCEDELLVEKVEVNNNAADFDCYIETASYSVKLYESEDDFGFDDDYNFVGEKTFSLINPLELIGGCMKVKSIDYSHGVFEAREDYAYYLFLDEQISTSTYSGIISGVFHNEYVMYASKVIIKIPDLNDISKTHVIRLTYKEEASHFILDLENKAIIDDKKRAKDKGHCLISSESIWEVDYISTNSKRKKESIAWIENRYKMRQKKGSIWKSS